MKKTLLISQPFGIGDLLFIQKIILHFANLGFHVVVPIMERLSWMRYYLAPHPDVEYPTIKSSAGKWSGDFKYAEFFVHLYSGSLFDTENDLYKSPILYNNADQEDGFTLLPLSSCSERVGGRLMPSKYEFVGLDFSDWVDYVHIKRRPHVERELYYDVLGLKDDTRFTLVNENSSRSSLPIFVPGNIVKLSNVDGFTLFDWSLVIEKSTQIVTIDTSLVLMAEILKQKKPLYVISRYNPPSFDEVKDILKLNWTFVPTPAELNVTPIV